MAKIPLRAYAREIKDLIENEHLEEAMAHCLHILKTFPMYVDAYRLLGEALLEARRYTEAADIFQRVLAAIPDDFIAHLGMSIARESENRLDDAIWHMERAFEMQPSNPAVQAELRRLYGRRDGVEPLKIRLSRDALANMYLQGELYNQAIAELRGLLSEDPQRSDLQVMLARAYFRAGRKTEAIETCAALLQKYPYCLDALRVMSDVLPATSHAENVQVYRSRLRNLDPYSAFATGSVFQADQVADNAVTLEHLEYQPGKPALPSHAEWAASLGISLEEEQPSGVEMPDWLAGVAQAEETPRAPGAEAPGETPLEDRIPDWMRAAGWGEATGAAMEGPLAAETGEPPSIEPASAAEIPDWLKAMAPASMLEPSSLAEETQPPTGEEAPDLEWLQSLELAQSLRATPVESGEAPEHVPAPLEEEAPDWLRGMMAEGGVPVTEPTAPEAGEETPGAVPESAEETPDWLRGMMAEGGVPVTESATPEAGEETPGAVPESAEETPDWLRGMMEESQKQPVAPASLESAEIPGWLKEETPEGEISVETEAKAEGEPSLPGVEMLEAISSMEATPAMAEEGENILDGSDALAWLEALAARQGARADELITSPESRPEETPEWVQRLAEESAAPGGPLEALAQGEAAESPVAAEPLETRPPVEERLEEPALEEEEGPPLEIPQLFPEPPEPATVAGQELAGEGVPAWSQELSEAERSGVSESIVEPAEELPDWLRDLAEEKPAEPISAAEEEIPDWLRAEFTEEAESGGVVQPSAEEKAIALPEEGMVEEALAGQVESRARMEVEEAEIPIASEEALPAWLTAEMSEETSAPPVAQAAEELAWAGREAALEAETTPAVPLMEEEPLPPEEAISGWAGKEAALEAETTIEPPLAMEEAEEPLAEMPKPTSPEEWVPEIVEEVGPADLSQRTAMPSPEQAIVSPAAPVRPSEKKLAAGPARDSEILLGAQTALRNGRLVEAMQEYERLIRKGKFLEEIIHDLQEAIYRYPVEVILWQTLGDAYMRANQLQDALDAYTKAEELLR